MLKFKMGDKVRITTFPDRYIVGSKCTIIAINTGYPDVKFPYRVRGKYSSGMNSGKPFGIPVMEREIEYTIRIGEQLLLFEL